MPCWDEAIKNLGWKRHEFNPQAITARYDACHSAPLVHPGGAFVASRLLLIRRVVGPGTLLVAHALRTLPQVNNEWRVRGWVNVWLGPAAPDGEDINFLGFMTFQGGHWSRPGDNAQYEIKLLTAEEVPN
jgi:hypothetical protein